MSVPGWGLECTSQKLALRQHNIILASLEEVKKWQSPFILFPAKGNQGMLPAQY
jgi:hypothetical protein